MDFLAGLLERRRLIVATSVLLAVAGLFSWLTMPREEDPQFPRRNGLVVVAFVGADAETVERLVVEPIEEHLAEVEEIKQVSSTSRAGNAILRIKMRDSVYDTDAAWDEVEDALALARRDFPAGVSEPWLKDDLVSQEAVVVAISGSTDPLVLAQGADRVKRSLLTLPVVKRVTEVADPGEQITIEYDDATARRLGLDPLLLGHQLGLRSRILPGGQIRLGAKTATLRPRTEFLSVDEISATPIVLPSGASVPLGELARVRHGPREPAVERMRWNGEPAYGLGVIPGDGLDRVRFGREVRDRLAVLRSEIAPLAIDEVVFQPDMVESRLRQLSGSLRLGILIVTAVLFLFMGVRLGITVALVVPLVTFGSLAIFANAGGVLHQVSIAALVIALGMLVDNAIVVVENIQWRLDQGTPPREAAIYSVRELAVPLGTATGTTLAAFVPMLLSKGGTGDFTRSIPILIMLTLAVSYVFAILVTPVLSELLLRRRRATPDSRGSRWTETLSRISVRHSGWVLAGAALLLVMTVGAAGLVKQQFFPAADRTTVIVDLQLPEGTHIEETDAMSRRVEAALVGHPEVASVATFVGRAAPHFYYNLLSKPASPHRVQLVAEATSLESVEEVIDWTRDYLHRELPEVEVVARRLEQGPPIDSPIAVRIHGTDLEAMGQTADEILGVMRSIPGSRDVRHDLGLGVPTVAFGIDDAAAGRYGLSRSDVALSLLGRTLGSEIGQYRVGEDPVPILVRSSAGEELPAADLETLDVASPGGMPVPLAQLARLEVEWRPAAIYHHNRSRIVTVRSQLAERTTAHEVQSALVPRLAELDLPPGVWLEYGGELEESGKANEAILATMPLGILLLLFFLLAEFNSFRRVGIILVTVPLAATGVVPGLLLSGQPFGFMSMLGVISLVGIVVNNAIVLLDVIESRRAEGMSIDDALREAVRRRTRPILLTMITTVAGLSPLAFSETSLWPPLAWAMISGLTASTVLTLLVVPALYRLLFRSSETRGEAPAPAAPSSPAATVAAATLVLLLLSVRPSEAASPAAPADGAVATSAAVPVATLSLAEVMDRASDRPLARSADERARGAEQRATAERRAAVLPTIGVAVDVFRRDRDFAFDTPLGAFTLGERTSHATAVQVTQPVLDPARLLYGVPAARSEAAARVLEAERTRQELRAEAARSFLAVLGIDARLRSTEAFIESLAARRDETAKRVEAGRVLEADLLKVRLELESAELDRRALLESRAVAVLDLGRAVGRADPVEPRPGPPEEAAGVPSYEEMVAAAASRPDLRAVEAQLRALELRAKTIRGERLPRLTAQARWTTSDGDPFRADELIEGTVGLTWAPFAAGTRAPRIAAIEAERSALASDLEELRRGVALGIRDALSRLETAREAVEVRRRGVELAAETLRVERERHSAGRSTTNDLLDAEARLRVERTAAELARLEVLRSRVELELAVGGPLEL